MEEITEDGTTLISPFAISSRSTVNIEFLGYVSWGAYGFTSGHFTVNGSTAFCVQHQLNTPSTGEAVSSYSSFDDPRVRAALYYGWEGPENIFSNDTLMTEGTADVLTNVFTEKIDTLDASYDEYDIGLLDRKIDLYTETASEEPTNLRTAIEKLLVVNSEGIGSIMQTGIIDTMGAVTAAENQNLAVYQEQKSKEIADVQKAFQEYDPLGYINQSEINGISSDLLSNNGFIQEKFLENNLEYIEFASGSNEVAQENVSSLVENNQ